MNVHLLYPDTESSPERGYPFKADIIKDLNLSRIFKTMAKDNTYIYSVVNSVMMVPLKSREYILFRQDMMRDVIANPIPFEEMFHKLEEVCTEINKFQSEETKLKRNGATITKAGAIFRSLEFLELLTLNLKELRNHIDQTEAFYSSTAMKSFCLNFKNEFHDEFIEQILASVREMVFLKDGGTLILSAVPGLGMQGSDLIINEIMEGGYKRQKKSFVDSVTGWYSKRFPKNTIFLYSPELIHDARELEQAGLHHVLKMYQSFINDLTSFFGKLYHQIAFYMGCFQLHSRLKNLVIPVCFPTMPEENLKIISFENLYDLNLAIFNRKTPICNDIQKEDKKLFIISGANQGGKSTYLRSLATAQLFMLAGVFVPARVYCCSLCGNIFTHFTRREDSAMNSGRLEEELKRMQSIMKEVRKNDMVFLNESFASTTEKEGSIIALDIAKILYENDIKLFTVTHLFEFTNTMYEQQPEHAVFLSAERKEGGLRTYKILEMPPSRTSFGMDLYDEIMN